LDERRSAISDADNADANFLSGHRSTPKISNRTTPDPEEEFR
jgi:hypothetical protein